MIVTFYSYKGGVGRSMALVNVGEILADAGYDVILCDFDLEAPGLERYVVGDAISMQAFRRRIGIIDLLEEYRRTLAEPSNANVDPTGPDFRQLNGLSLRRPTACAIDTQSNSASRRGRLRLLPAGRRDGQSAEQYAAAVQRFDWSDFYDRWAGAAYFDYFRSDLIEGRTIVLIDSRTGVTELGGVCTHHLADLAILLSGPNDINIEGTRWMLKSLAEIGDSDLRRGRPLHALPVASRVETTSQVRELASFRSRFETEFAGEIPQAVGDGQRFLRSSEIPYVPYYALTEQVVARATDTQHRELYAAYKTIAEAITDIGLELNLLAPRKILQGDTSPEAWRDPSSLEAVLDLHLRWLASKGASGVRANLRKWDLRQHEFDGAVLSEADLSEANLEQADLRGVNLRGSALRGSILRNARLDGANLVDSDMSSVDLTRSELSGAMLDRCKLGDANCDAANFTSASMQNADLRGARLDRATMIDCDLRKANLTAATLEGTVLGGADLRGAVGIWKSHATLVSAILTTSTRIDAYGRPAILDEAWREESVWSQTADHMKRSVQTARLAALGIIIIVVVFSITAAAISSAYPTASRLLAAIAGAGSVVPPLLRPLWSGRRVSDWTRARSVSEALKADVYLWLAGIRPFADDPHAEKLLDRVDKLRLDAADLVRTGSRVKPEDRPLPAVHDLRTYFTERVQSQYENYYQPKAISISVRLRAFRMAELLLGTAGLVLGFGAAILDTSLAAWIAVAVAIAIAISLHVATYPYEMQRVEYLRTAEELRQIMARAQVPGMPENELHRLARRAERVISIENQGWMAKLASDSGEGARNIAESGDQ